MISESGPHTNPALATFSRTVELRVSAGVQNVVTSLKKAEQKEHMLEHAKRLVLTSTGTHLSRYHFETPLENVFLKESACSSTPAAPIQIDDRQPLALPKASEPREGSIHVRLIQTHYFMDSSKQFVIIVMQLEILRLPTSSLSTNDGDVRISMMIRPKDTVSMVWELDAIQGQQEGDTVRLAARSPVTTLAVTPSLGEQHLHITARFSNGYSQFLGAFTISNILQSSFGGDSESKRGVEHGYPLFRSVHFVVEGRNIQGIHHDGGNLAELIGESTFTQAREDLALLSFSASCRTALATAVARLHAGTDDDANVRGTMSISPSSLSLLDNFLILLEKETHSSRQIAARKDTFGYTLPDIKHILELQLATDNCLGVMEESYLESWG